MLGKLSAAEGMGEAAAKDALQRAGLEVDLVPCLDDNYCPVVHHSASSTTLVMDTPEAGAISSAILARGWSLTHILNTHHHGDHVGGNIELKRLFPEAKIIGPHECVFEYPGPFPPKGFHTESIPGIDLAVAEGDVVDCGGLRARVIEVGGHTDSHIAYFFEDSRLALTGDALFTLGVGRVFTGNFPKMFASMQKLRALPDDTICYGAHEYTAANAKFCVQVDPNNAALQERDAQIKALRAEGRPTVPTLLGHEKVTNPFLRWDDSQIKAAVGLQDPLAVFTAVRRWKDTGKRPEVVSAKL